MLLREYFLLTDFGHKIKHHPTLGIGNYVSIIFILYGPTTDYSLSDISGGKGASFRPKKANDKISHKMCNACSEQHNSHQSYY